MNRIVCILSALVLAAAAYPAVAQNAIYVQGLFVGSEGTTSKEAPGAEGSLDAFHNEFLQAMGLRSRGNTVLALTALGGQSAYDRISAMQRASDSTDIAVGVVLGAWQKHAQFLE